MVRLSFFAASALVSLAAGQIDTQSLISPSGEPAVQAPEANCGGCYVGADIAGIVFGGVETQTVVQVTNVITGPNGTVISTAVTTATSELTTSFSTPVTTDMFTFSDGDLISPTFVETRYNRLDSAITISGATLTSPTQYELFTAYSITSFESGSDGQCSPVSGTPIAVSPAFSVPVPDGAMGNFLTVAENSFIDFLAVTCLAGGGNVASTIQSMIDETTTESVTTGPTRIQPIPATTSADTPTITSTANATISTPTISTGMPMPPSFTDIGPSIMPGAGSAVAPGVFGVGAAFGIGLAAMFL